MERRDRNAGQVLRLRLHLREERVDVGGGAMKHVGRQLEPHLQTAQHVRRPVAHARRDALVEWGMWSPAQHVSLLEQQLVQPAQKWMNLHTT